MLWAKRALQCTIFQTFECSNESSHNFSRAVFETTRSGFTQILHHCSVSWKMTPLYIFYLKPHILWTKVVHWSGIFRLLSGWVKNQQISHVVLETASHFFFKLFHHSLILWEITLLYLSSQNFIWFLQKKSINVKNFRLSSAQLKFHQVCILIGSFCWKYIKISAKKVQENTKCDAKFEEKNDLLF